MLLSLRVVCHAVINNWDKELECFFGEAEWARVVVLHGVILLPRGHLECL